jgi:hypothetical protein
MKIKLEKVKNKQQQKSYDIDGTGTIDTIVSVYKV